MTNVFSDEVDTILGTVPAFIFMGRADGYVEYVNRTWLDYLGLPFEAVEGWQWMKYVHPDDRDGHVQRWQQSIEEGETAISEARYQNASGEYRWMLVHTRPLRDADGKIVRWIGSAVDISELRSLKEELHKENIALRDAVSEASMFEEIIGSSEPLRRVLMLVAKVARSDSTVLITGETGTGKELIARAIHKRSTRASRPFVSVNCGAIPQSLVASELFGHEKGAFTGAMQRHLGRFELADGGTIFLDEVGELPAETQIALLRVLQERKFERVGGTRLMPVDVRVIAATNRDLARAIDDGLFRSDLYYRLSVFPIHVPPLRDRAEDVPLLVEYLTQRYAAKAGKKITQVGRRTMELLTAYSWPGNVRELQNVIQRAVILCDDDVLVVDPAWLASKPTRRNERATGLGRPSMNEEKELIEDALAASHGRVAGADGAAARLRVPRSTLESKIRSLHIDKHRFKSQ